MINDNNRSKVFISIIGILLVANIALVSFFLLKKDGGKPEKRPDRKTMIANFLKNEIGFSAAQLQQYDTLSTGHSEKIKNMFDSLRSNKDKQFKQLAMADFSDSAMNQIAEQSGHTQKMMELKMFNHLKKIRLLCTSEQQPKFDSLFVKVLNRRGGDARKKQEEKNSHQH